MLVPALAASASVPVATGFAAEGAETVPTFAARAEAVRVNVVVTRDRQPVLDLEPKDFRVFEDGAPQQVAYVLREQELALSIVIMIDSSSSMTMVLPAARAAALRLVEILGDRDRAQIVEFHDRASARSDFTSDREALAGALDGIVANGHTALYTSLYVVLKDLVRRPATVAEQRAVVLLTDGMDAGSALSDEDVLELAANADVSVYPIALRRKSLLRSEHAEAADHFLTRLAAYTGASVHFPRSVGELDGVYADVARELRTQYSLGYVPSNPRRDGNWRSITVLTPAESNLRVRHKRGYRAPRR